MLYSLPGTPALPHRVLPPRAAHACLAAIAHARLAPSARRPRAGHRAGTASGFPARTPAPRTGAPPRIARRARGGAHDGRAVSRNVPGVRSAGRHVAAARAPCSRRARAATRGQDPVARGLRRGGCRAQHGVRQRQPAAHGGVGAGHSRRRDQRRAGRVPVRLARAHACVHATRAYDSHWRGPPAAVPTTTPTCAAKRRCCNGSCARAFCSAPCEAPSRPPPPMWPVRCAQRDVRMGLAAHASPQTRPRGSCMAPRAQRRSARGPVPTRSPTACVASPRPTAAQPSPQRRRATWSKPFSRCAVSGAPCPRGKARAPGSPTAIHSRPLRLQTRGAEHALLGRSGLSF